jgi:hypothetical protein
MEPPAPIPETPPPPGAIPAEKLHNGLRGHLQKNEHVLWQGRGSGRAFNALGRGFLMRIGLLLVAAGLLLWLMFDNRNPTYNWVVWALLGLLLARLALFIWQSSATPSRQVAMLTTERLVSVDLMRPITNWQVKVGGEARADGKYNPPHPIVVTGTKERGHIRLNTAPQNTRAYPPFVLFNAERPLEVAQLIKKTLKIDQPIEDKTK